MTIMKVRLKMMLWTIYWIVLVFATESTYFVHCLFVRY